jgi:hypothetical protein
MRIADATCFELVIRPRRPNAPRPHQEALDALGFDLIGTLQPNPEDGIADFVVFREPTPFEGSG